MKPGFRNEDLPAGSPMVFACRGCEWPIVVPECYVHRPAFCERCGGPWSELEPLAIAALIGAMQPAESG